MHKYILFLLLFYCINVQAQHTYDVVTNEMVLSNWKYSLAGKNNWESATVPGNIQMDLMKNSIISNPFKGNHFLKLQWIEDSVWEYQTSFFIPKIKNDFTIKLVFEGIDTYSEIYLNNTLIQETDNMFMAYEIDVNKLLIEGENKLLIKIFPTQNFAKQKAAQLKYTLPEGERVFTRKAQYHYGWDFAPKIKTVGIWKNVKLAFYETIKIKNIHYHTQINNNSTADIQFVFETFCNQKNEYTIVLFDEKNKINQSKKLTSELGINYDTINIKIKNPKLWWCNELGNPYLYRFNYNITEINSENKLHIIESNKINVGIRTIELIKDKDNEGQSFYFKINGIPVFVKGANYVPIDIFNLEQKIAEENKLLSMCKQQHFNMIRVWGGGVYASDNFYKQCNELGIMVWQDFMFACSMYPGDSSFLNTIEEEVSYQIKRIRNNPSLALWCGNNEIDEGWNNWGWQKQFKYTQNDSIEIAENNKTIFYDLIPNLVNRLDNKTAYHASSPTFGWGRKESLTHGDMHYWGVWWGKEPFKIYENKVGRFMSEYGFQSMPNLSVLKIYNLTDSTHLKLHQKHPTGFETIDLYLNQHYKNRFDKTSLHYIYLTQLVQRDGMKTAIETHRANKPYCMGTLFWQLNDCWPGITWSAIDYNQQPKAFFYQLKESYKPILIVIKKQNNYFEIKLVSDSLNTISGKLNIAIKDFKGNIVFKKTISKTIHYNSTTAYNFDLNGLGNFDSTKHYLVTTFNSEKNIELAKNYLFFCEPKNLNLPKATLQINKTSDDFFKIESNVFVKDLFIYSDLLNNNTFELDKNFINLEPNKPAYIKIKSLDSIIEPSDLKYISNNNLY